MNTIIVGNIICFVGSLIMVATGLIKNNKNVLKAQSVMHVFLGAGNLVLGGMSGFIANALSFIRNFFCITGNYNPALKLIFIALQVILTLVTSLKGMGANIGLATWLPVIAVCVYTWGLDTQNAYVLKGLLIFAQSTWLVYDILIINYSSAVFDVATIIANIVGIVLISKGTKKISEEMKETPSEEERSVTIK